MELDEFHAEIALQLCQCNDIEIRNLSTQGRSRQTVLSPVEVKKIRCCKNIVF